MKRYWGAFFLLALLMLGWSDAALTVDDPASEAAAFQQQAAKALQEGHIGDVEPLLKRSVELLETALAPNDPKLVASLNQLADFYEIQGRYADAEPVYKRVIAIRVGNPVLAGDPGTERGAATRLFRNGSGADIRQLPALPETADELRAIAKTLGASEDDLLLGNRATEPTLRQMPLDRYRVIEFATHGLLAGEVRGLTEPALVLTPPANSTPENDGLLTASKIATLKLDADWIVLSACNTATSEDNPAAAGWSGLAKAFFYAGARSLLISQWPVWSRATVALTTNVMGGLAKNPGIGRAEALRRAEMAMLDPKNPPEFAHPLAWAPFVLAGEGGAGR